MRIGKKQLGYLLGPLLFVFVMFLPPPQGMTVEGKAVLAITLWIATWWITQPIPIPATALLPIVLMPATEVLTSKEVTSNYANPLIYIFLGGFMIALSMERWQLHKRLALFILSKIGSDPAKLVLGFMATTAFLSMWISNTSATMMMIPIGSAVISQMSPLVSKGEKEDNFGTALMLGIAYSASVGGIATLIGTPPNIVFAGIFRSLYGIDIGFAQWMLFGFPLAVVGVLLIWLYLTRRAYPLSTEEIQGASEVISSELKKLGRMSYEEKAILVVFVLVAFSWITRPFLINAFLPMIDDATIAIAGAILLFVIPRGLRRGQFISDWSIADKLPWGTLILFGGGLALADGFSKSRLAAYLGELVGLIHGAPLLVILLISVYGTIFLTEVTSNTATASILLPIMGTISVALGENPVYLMVGVTVAASCAFMLPVATPPNAIVYGTGKVKAEQMAKAGLALNLAGGLLVSLYVFLLLPLLWGNVIKLF